MPGDPKECRERALRCLKLAKRATSPQTQAKFLDLAATWAKLASDLEAMKVLLETEDKPSS